MFEKTALNVNIPMPALTGALAGTFVAKKSADKKVDAGVNAFFDKQSLPGSYYAQTDNIANNLKVLFTPYSVVYIVRNGNRETTIETIATEAMNRDMYIAWQEKNAMYFKNLLLNKMKAEVQFAQQQFAKNIIDRQLAVTKKASLDFTPMEIMSYAASIEEIYSKDGNEKLASTMFGDMDIDELSNFKLELSAGEITKSAMEFVSDIFSKPLGFLNLADKAEISKVEKDFMTPGHIKRFGHVGFLPDRVCFIVDNVVITQLLVFDMDEDAFKAFEKQDKNYFMNLFEKEAKMGVRRMNSKIPPEKKNMIKNASITLPIEYIFYDNDVSPYVFMVLLNNKYGEEWFSYEPEVLIKVIEKDFNLVDPIPDITLNKLLCCQLANASPKPFETALVFEKMIRSFNNLPINFFMKETDNLGPTEFAIGLTDLDLVTPSDDTYDNFSMEVYSYIVKVLADQNVKFFVPSKNYSESKNFEFFYTELNNSLVNENNRRDIEGVDDLKKQADIIEANEKINECCIRILSTWAGDKNNIAVTASAMGIENYKDIIEKQIYDVLAADEALDKNEEIINSQLGIYGLEE